MGIVVLLLVLVTGFITNVSANEYLYIDSIEDSVRDLLNIWTGKSTETYIECVDLVYASIKETEDFLIVHINVHGEIPSTSEFRIFYYVLLDADENPENNCIDPPMDYCDTMYAVIVNFTHMVLSQNIYTLSAWYLLSNEVCTDKKPSEELLYEEIKKIIKDSYNIHREKLSDVTGELSKKLKELRNLVDKNTPSPGLIPLLWELYFRELEADFYLAYRALTLKS